MIITHAIIFILSVDRMKEKKYRDFYLNERGNYALKTEKKMTELGLNYI